MTSRVPATKAALLAALADRPGLAGVQVEWAHPGKNIRPEAIYLGETTPAQRAAALGKQRREETFGLVVVVTVLQRGADAKATELRMWALVAEIEDYLREDPAIGDSGCYVAQIGEVAPDTFPGPAQQIAEATVRIDCRARI